VLYIAETAGQAWRPGRVGSEQDSSSASVREV